MKKILILLLLPLFSYSQFNYKGYEYNIQDILKNQLLFFIYDDGTVEKKIVKWKKY